MKIALTLSGGGARCVAQLGYLEPLFELGIRPQAISGSSGGAIIGAFLAKGYTPKECLELIKNFPYGKISLNLFRGSLFDLGSIYEKLKALGLESFEELPIPFFATVTEYESGRTRYLHSGDLALSVLASCALIPIFAPITIDGIRYIDGGFTDNLPLNPIKKYPFRLSINVNPLHHLPFKKSFWGNLKRAGYIMLNANVRPSIPLATKHVQIEETGNFGILDTKHFDQIYAIGAKIAQKEMEYWHDCLRS